MIVQLLLFLFAGTLGDYGSLRKKLLIISGLSGSCATMLLVAVYDQTYWLSGVCLVLLQVSLGFSLIQYNAYLPIIVANLPEVRKHRGTPEHDAVEETTANKVSTRGFVFGYVAGVLLLLINVGVSVGTPTSCTQWCRDCPTELGNETFAGWNAYEYQIHNLSMQNEQIYCSSDRTCYAWPGINPPCGAGVIDVDIVNETCVNTAAWQHYTYTDVGARWSLNNTVANVTAAIEVADNSTTLCTLKSQLRGDMVRASSPGDNSTQGLFAGLSADSGNGGCPHFRCRRSDCARGYDPSTCDPIHIGYRMNLMIAGLWWGLFGLITYFGIKTRPGPPMPKENIVKAGLKRTWVTIKKVRKLKHTFLFLMAFFFYGDGFSTIAFGAALVATSNPLFFSSLQLGILLLESNFTALLGNFFYLWLSNLMVSAWRKRKLAAGANPEELDRFVLFLLWFVLFCFAMACDDRNSNCDRCLDCPVVNIDVWRKSQITMIET